MKKIEIKIESNNLIGEHVCWLCGMEFDLDVVVTGLYVDGERRDDICQSCFSGGADEIRRKLRRYANETNLKGEIHLDMVQGLLARAAEAETLAAGEIVCPPMEELDAALETHYAHIGGAE